MKLQRHRGAELFNAPSLAFIYFTGPVGPTLRNTPAALPEITSHQEPMLHSLFGDPPYSLQTYQIKGGQHQLVIEQSSTVALVEIYPGNGLPLRLVVACKTLSAPLTVSFGSEAEVDGSCPASDASPDVTYSAGARIRFTQRIGQPPPQVVPDDWDAEPSVSSPEGGRLFTLRAKRTASSRDLGISAKIAEVLY